MLLFGLLSIRFLYRALYRHEHGNWLWLGIALGLAGLSKYTAITLVMVCLLATLLQHRLTVLAVFKRWQVWGAIGLALVLILPVLYWNATSGSPLFTRSTHSSPHWEGLNSSAGQPTGTCCAAAVAAGLRGTGAWAGWAGTSSSRRAGAGLRHFAGTAALCLEQRLYPDAAALGLVWLADAERRLGGAGAAGTVAPWWTRLAFWGTVLIYVHWYWSCTASCLPHGCRSRISETRCMTCMAGKPPRNAPKG